MKKSRLEPFEILTANRRRNPLVASAETKVSAAPDEGIAKPVPKPSEREKAAPDAAQRLTTVSIWSRMRRRTLLTVRVTPLVVALIGLLVCLIVGASFWKGYRAGSAELPLPAQAPVGSFDEIRRNHIVMFDELEVDRGKLRR